MAVRYRKYHSQCKSIPCNGRKGKNCPSGRPKKSNGEFNDCGVWCVEFFDDNKKWQSLTFKDVTCKTEAEKRLALFISDRERGKLNLPRKKVIPTLTEYSRTYLELYKNAKERTLATRKSQIAVLTRYLGDYPLDKITSFIVERFRIEYKEKDKIKDGTVNDYISTLCHLFNTAIKADIGIDKNPCDNIKRLKVTHSRDRVLTTDEINLLLNTLRHKDRLMMLTALLTGMRLNEVLSLKWQDIDFGRGVIAFTQSKTGKLVIVPMSSYLVNELVSYKATHSSDNLFEDRTITKAVATKASNRFAKLFKQILGCTGVSFHTLRHTFASLQIDLGIGANAIREMLGHSNLSMTARYSHGGMDVKVRAIETLTDHVFNGKVLTAVSQTGTA